MEDDIRKPVVYLDLHGDSNKEQLIKRLTGRSPEEAASLEEKFAFWLDLMDR